jgi:N-acetylneuraminic acid mutarotase
MIGALTAATSVGAAPSSGAWQKLPPAPVEPREALVSVWTGKQMFLFGRITKQLTPDVVRVNVAELFDPATRRWRRLPSPGPTTSFFDYSGVWTGKEVIVWGQGVREAFDPSSARWRQLPGSRLLSVHQGFGFVAWTGKEMIGWGGGCCGDAFDDGVAFDPRTSRWRALPRAPLAGSTRPIGAWTGRELILLVGDTDPDGKPWPARLARAAAYDPSSNTWRRLPRIPEPRNGATAVWDGRELLVVGGTAPGPAGKPAPLATTGFAFDPSANRWRRLPPMESGRVEAASAWTGRKLLLWGGSAASPGSAKPAIPPHGLVYDPRANRWEPLPPAPLLGRLDPAAVWTGRQLLLWGGSIPKSPPGSGTRFFADGAAFTPAG